MLIAEACNHNRITEMCNDIGMVQVCRGFCPPLGYRLVLGGWQRLRPAAGPALLLVLPWRLLVVVQCSGLRLGGVPCPCCLDGSF